MLKMKNFIITLFLILISVPQVFAVTNEELREQAKVLYMGHKTSEAKERIMLIPEAQRAFSDYYLLGLTSESPLDIIKSYEKAVELKPNFYQGYYNLGSYYFDAKDYEKAVNYYKLAVKYNKEFAEGYYNLGCAYLQLEKYSKARTSFEKAIKLQPEEADYYYNLGYVYKKINNQKRAEKAINLYNDLIKRRTEN